MKEMIITVNSEKEYQLLLDFLSYGEENGMLNFSFQVRREW